MPSLLFVDYLQRSRANYTLLNHDLVYTAEDTARLLHIPPRRFAKVVMVKIDGELAMMLVPAHYRVALEPLRRALAAARIELAAERQFRYRFPRCEIGAMPPFGHLFGLRTLIAPVFDEFSEVVFKAGSHTEAAYMPFAEFRRLAHVEPVAEGAVPRLRELSPTRLQRLRDIATGLAPRPIDSQAALLRNR
jgi:Ala-tRNA(Pro) deacylase